MNQDGIITKPINIETDLGYVLGTGSGEVSVNFQSPSVKPWAKYKGIASSLIGVTGKTSGNNYWQGANHQCGFSIPVFTSFGDFESLRDDVFCKKLYAGQIDWEYVHPTGGTLSPYRPLDFDGYDHNAICPIGDIGGTTLYLSIENGVRVLHLDYEYNTKNGDWLQLSDIHIDNTTLAAYYLGAFFVNGQRWFALSGTTPLGNSESSGHEGEGYSMSCEFPEAYAGVYEIVPFLTKNIIPLKYSDVADGSFLAFYNRHRIEVTIKLGSVTITPMAYWSGQARKAAWEVVIDNDDASTKYFTNPVVYVCRTSTPEESPDEDGVQIGSTGSAISDFSIRGAARTTLTSDTYGLITINEDISDSYYYWVRFSCSQTGYITNWQPFDQFEIPE